MANTKNSRYNQPNIQYCRYCNKECKNTNSLKQHECRCKENPDRRNFLNLQSAWNNPWNKGLDKTDIRIQKHIISYNKNKELGLHKPYEYKHTEEFKKKQSINALKNHYENHFGSRKSYLYNGVKFISSYELKVAKDLDDNNIKWQKPSRLPYIDFNGKNHHYTADFYLPEYDVYLDPKNTYLIENINPKMGYSDKQKIDWVMEQNNVKIIILNENQLCWKEIKEMILMER